MKASLIFFFTILLTVSGDKIKRQNHPFGSGGFPSFFSSAKTPFESNSYSSPVASHPPPAPSYPAPSKQEATHNCNITHETSQAEVCVPSLGEPQCGPVTLKGIQVGEKEKCLSITKSVCTVSQEAATAEVCTIQYTSKEETAEATLVDVSFNKECSSQMVTVCEPGYHSHSYGYDKGSYQKCEEIAQETCYNKPVVVPTSQQVNVRVPSPEMSCGPQTFNLPTVDCQEVTEERCVKLPSLDPADVEAEQCTVPLGPSNCNQVTLTLPVQVCREQLYGEAHKPQPVPTYPAPVKGYN